MSEQVCRQVLEMMPAGYALHKIIFNHDGFPCDYEYVQANKAFEKVTGLSASDIIGKNVTQVSPEIRKGSINWIKSYSEVALNGQQKEFQQYSFKLKRWYKVTAYSPITGYIATLVADITKEALARQIQRQSILVDVFSKDFQTTQELLDYSLLKALELTSSEYGCLYYYNEESCELTLKSKTMGIMEACEDTDLEAEIQIEKMRIMSEAVRQRKPIIINDIFQSSCLKREMLQKNTGRKSFLSIPIMIRGIILAVVCLENIKSEYSDTDVNEIIILMQHTCLTAEKKSAQMQIVAEREKYQSILDELPVLICEYLPDSTLTFVNRAYCSFFGMPAESLINKKFLDFVEGNQRESVRQRHLCITPISRTNDYEIEYEHHGKKQCHRLRDIGIFDKEGIPLRYCSVGFDITEQKASLEENESLLAQRSAMFNEHKAVMLLIDPTSGKIIDANPSASYFYGYSKEELLNINMKEINQHSDNLFPYWQKVISREQNQFTFPHKLKSGQIRTVDVLSCPISYEMKTLLFSIIVDVTEREEALKKIIYISNHDYLTGAHNRRFFEEEFARINTESNFPITVLLGNVNGLKLINDSFGHNEGDAILKFAVKRIEESLKPGDVFARIGGDEFGVILTKTSRAEAEEIGRKIKQNIEKNTDDNPQKSFLSISFGLAVQETMKQSLGELMKEAEGYMYNKKYYDTRSRKGRTVQIIMKTLFEKSPRENMHSERVGNISAEIAIKLGFDIEQVNKIRVAGFLHDIGKIGIPENILNKKGKLDAQELATMKRHPEKSRRILENTYEYSEISNIVFYHHEKWDGSGYPKGLKGEEIPLESRIISVADAYDAMTNNRSYREKNSPEEAINELIRCSGTHFDPEIIEVFVEQVLKGEKGLKIGFLA